MDRERAGLQSSRGRYLRRQSSRGTTPFVRGASTVRATVRGYRRGRGASAHPATEIFERLHKDEDDTSRVSNLLSPQHKAPTDEDSDKTAKVEFGLNSRDPRDEHVEKKHNKPSGHEVSLKRKRFARDETIESDSDARSATVTPVRAADHAGAQRFSHARTKGKHGSFQTAKDQSDWPRPKRPSRRNLCAFQDDLEWYEEHRKHPFPRELFMSGKEVHESKLHMAQFQKQLAEEIVPNIVESSMLTLNFMRQIEQSKSEDEALPDIGIDYDQQNRSLAVHMLESLTKRVSAAIATFRTVEDVKKAFNLIPPLLKEVEVSLQVDGEDKIESILLQAQQLINVLDKDDLAEAARIMIDLEISLLDLLNDIQGNNPEPQLGTGASSRYKRPSITQAVNKAIARMVPNAGATHTIWDTHIKPLRENVSSIETRLTALLEFFNDQHRDNLARMCSQVSDATTIKQLDQIRNRHAKIQYDLQAMKNRTLSRLANSVRADLEKFRNLVPVTGNIDFDRECGQVMKVLEHIFYSQSQQAMFPDTTFPSF